MSYVLLKLYLVLEKCELLISLSYPQQYLAKKIISYINNIIHKLLMTDNIVDDAAKKMKNTAQDAEAKAETARDDAEGKPSSETLNKAKVKIRDALD